MSTCKPCAARSAYDRPRFFAELRAFIGVAARLAWRLGTLQREFRDAAERYGKREFWNAIHGLEPRASQAPEPAAEAVETDLRAAA